MLHTYLDYVNESSNERRSWSFEPAMGLGKMLYVSGHSDKVSTGAPPTPTCLP